MLFAPEDLKAMYAKVTTADLEARLDELRDKISHLRSRGLSWAYDSREIRIAEHNEDLVFAELRRRKEEDAQSSKK
tara:strand:+ start:122 stop:349 length:228 start_codon:yes stop_codon:yes gene_type:complete